MATITWTCRASGFGVPNAQCQDACARGWLIAQPLPFLWVVQALRCIKEAIEHCTDTLKVISKVGETGAFLPYGEAIERHLQEYQQGDTPWSPFIPRRSRSCRQRAWRI
jgi:hypothetical protein